MGVIYNYFVFAPTMEHKSVCVGVVMPVFNGERFLLDTISSVLKQEGVCVHLFVRDDGSGDKSLEILKSLSEHVETSTDTPLGSSASYFFLLKLEILRSLEFVAFCDQDDIWFSKHLITAVSSMRMSGKDCCYSANLIYKNGKFKFENYFNPNKPLLPYYEHPYHGSGYVFSSRLIPFLTNLPDDRIIQHDFALYIIARILGTLEFNKSVTWVYVIHDNNERGLRKYTNVIRVIFDFENWYKTRQIQGQIILKSIIAMFEADSAIYNNHYGFVSKSREVTKLFNPRQLYKFRSRLLEDLFIRAARWKSDFKDW